MKNKLFTLFGLFGAGIGIYFLGSYFYEYITGRFIPTMKQFTYFL
ncbi:MAG: hypothetical protein RR587_06245 [Solibacillus sp.]